jgi:hypothetical protein
MADEDVLREWYTEPNEVLYGSTDTLKTFARTNEFVKHVNADKVSVIYNAGAKIPIIDYGQQTRGKLLATINADLWWHPLLWLPTWLIARRNYDTDGVENDLHYAYRVAYLLTFSDVYEQETGAWLDVLDTYDISEEEIRDYIANEASEETVEKIESVDLSMYFSGDVDMDALEKSFFDLLDKMLFSALVDIARYTRETATDSNALDFAKELLKQFTPMYVTDELLAMDSAVGFADALENIVFGKDSD